MGLVFTPAIYPNHFRMVLVSNDNYAVSFEAVVPNLFVDSQYIGTGAINQVQSQLLDIIDCLLRDSVRPYNYSSLTYILKSVNCFQPLGFKGFHCLRIVNQGTVGVNTAVSL